MPHIFQWYEMSDFQDHYIQANSPDERLTMQIFHMEDHDHFDWQIIYDGDLCALSLDQAKEHTTQEDAMQTAETAAEELLAIAGQQEQHIKDKQDQERAQKEHIALVEQERHKSGNFPPPPRSKQQTLF